MRCDYCSAGNSTKNKFGLQMCENCSLQICRKCIENGMLEKDEKHRMDAQTFDGLKWRDSAQPQRSQKRKAAEVTESAPPNTTRREQHQKKPRNPLPPQGSHPFGDQHGPAIHGNGSQDPRVWQQMNPRSSGDFNTPVDNYQYAGHGPSSYGQLPPGYPSGAAPLPPHALQHDVGMSRPGQHGQLHSQGGLSMPPGPMYGHHFSTAPGLQPQPDPRFYAFAQPFPPNAYVIPQNSGDYHGVYAQAYTPAPIPQGIAGPGFYHSPSQQQPLEASMYNGRGYVPRGNMPNTRPAPGPAQYLSQPYGGSPHPRASPSQEPPQGRGRESRLAQGGQNPRSAQYPREAGVRTPLSHGNAEQPFGFLRVQQQQQQQAWEQEQQRAQQAIQQLSQQPVQQTIRRNVEAIPQQQHQKQLVAQGATRMAQQQGQQAQKQKQQQQTREQRLEQHGQQRSQQQPIRPVTETRVVSGPPPVTTSSLQGLQESQTAVPAPAPRQAGLETNIIVQSSQVQRRDHQPSPNVVDYTQRPFGIPAFARDLAAGRSSHYDETARRWAGSPPGHAQQPRKQGNDDEDYIIINDGWPYSPSEESDDSDNTDQKQPLSRASPVDSTLSAELDQAASKPGAKSLHGELLDDPEVARVRREEGEQAALALAGAANTLHGGGRGLHGVADAQVVANDQQIQQRQDVLNEYLRHEEERRGAKRQKKEGANGDGGGGDVARGGGSGRGGSRGGPSGGVGV
ncbi:hypothetical protein J7T55_008281 [Diaporthe amygdali]|uniref:uncharacterized protein n=1 Tax=Phomopsis amygdali TaxID=1214568 RepID=UPI0022FE5CDD|nr:uncharacterized protein J7T55_008281 [Diaporthe amygdali]KAJ0121119.1 hypothetical protein J7T55_008281 [Diaporthe amygdali]